MKHLKEYINEGLGLALLVGGASLAGLVGLTAPLWDEENFDDNMNKLFPLTGFPKESRKKLLEVASILKKYKKQIKGDKYHYPILNEMINSKKGKLAKDFYYKNNGYIKMQPKRQPNGEVYYKEKWVEKEVDKDLLDELDMLLSNDDFNKVTSVIEYFKSKDL